MILSRVTQTVIFFSCSDAWRRRRTGGKVEKKTTHKHQKKTNDKHRQPDAAMEDWDENELDNRNFDDHVEEMKIKKSNL